MITVKLYGLLRIESGIREVHLDAKTVKEALEHLEDRGLSRKELSGCAIFINGTSATKRSRLKNGDTVILMPPVAGG